MTTPRDIGGYGEQQARAFLEAKGYQLLAANWQCKAGELDLIMVDPSDDCRVIVEVRLRRRTSYGAGDETVAYQKQQKLLRTARWYQQKANYWGHLRFDVVSIEVDAASSQPTITHIPDAFGA